MSMNWDEVLRKQEEEGGDFDALPADTYDVVVHEAEAVTASTGAPMIKTVLKVEGGPYDGRQVWTNIVFSENVTAMRFTLRKLDALGLSKETIMAQNPSVSTIAKMITGARARAEVQIRQYEGEDRNDVKSFKRADGAAPLSVPTVKPEGVPSVPSSTPVPPTSGAAGGLVGATVPSPTAVTEAPDDEPGYDDEPF